MAGARDGVPDTFLTWQVREVVFQVRLYVEAEADVERCSVVATSGSTIEIGGSFGFDVVARDIEGLPVTTGRREAHHSNLCLSADALLPSALHAVKCVTSSRL